MHDLGRPLRRFLVWALLVVATAAAVAWMLAVHLAEREARDDAAHTAVRMARSVGALRIYVDPTAPGYAGGMLRLDQAVHDRIAEGLVLRVKIWDAEGTVLYSDEPRLIGQTFGLKARSAALIERGGAYAELTRLEANENLLDQQLGKEADTVVEAYAAFTSADGEPLLLEAYFPEQDLLEHKRETAVWLVPAMIAGPVVVGALMFGLALDFSRHLRAAEQETLRALQRVVAAMSGERRRIARELHDSVIPELAAVRLALDSAAKEETDPRRQGRAEELSATVSRQLRALRQVLSRERWPSPSRVGLDAALEAVADPARAEGIDVICTVTATDLDDPAARLALAVAGEGLRNVRRHSGAQRATVAVTADPEFLFVRVADDGDGLDTDQVRSEHGLGLIADTVADLGGETRLEPVANGGAQLTVRVPRARLASDVPPVATDHLNSS